MNQTTVSGGTIEPEVLTQEHAAAKEQILRLECLVSCLLEKNERLGSSLLRIATKNRSAHQPHSRTPMAVKERNREPSHPDLPDIQPSR